MIRTISELEELLSRPTDADRQAMAALDGDLIILGAGGKMGPTLALRAKRAMDEIGAKHRVIAVSHFSMPTVRESLTQAGVHCVPSDLVDPEQVSHLPDAPYVILAAGRKFGSTGEPQLTWAMNVLLPSLIAQRYASSRLVAFSSGNIYPLTPIVQGGSQEGDETFPAGEYGWTVLGRERMLDYHSRIQHTPVTILRLNYAVELRYGVLLDIGRKVLERRAIDLGMGAVNLIWQGDANSVALRSFALASSPPRILNLTGPETISVRRIAEKFGRIFGIPPLFVGQEGTEALLNNASQCQRLFGYPSFTPDELIEWTASWISIGGSTLNKPTHYEARDGKF